VTKYNYVVETSLVDRLILRHLLDTRNRNDENRGLKKMTY